MITIERKVHFQQGRRSRKEMQEGEATSELPTGRVPRVSRMMALAIRFEGLIHQGVVADQADLARLGCVTRARVTQIMNLLQLAPDIQEEVLFLPRIECGGEPIQESQLRHVANVHDWRRQRQCWVQRSSNS